MDRLSGSSISSLLSSAVSISNSPTANVEVLVVAVSEDVADDGFQEVYCLTLTSVKTSTVFSDTPRTSANIICVSFASYHCLSYIIYPLLNRVSIFHPGHSRRSKRKVNRLTSGPSFDHFTKSSQFSRCTL
jgi:hypothetical protein